MKTIIILVSAFLIILLLSVKFNWTRKKQIRNIRKADVILQKINSFPEVNQEAKAICYLRKIDPFVFEELLLNAFKLKGFTIERNKRYTHDGGIDGKVYLNGKLILIQAKRYKSYVNTKHLSEFLALVQTSGACKGYFIHTGKTGKETYQKYRNSEIEIISGDKLIKLIRQS